MNEAQLSPLAEKLIFAYQETAGISRQFRDEYHAPLTVMAKAHVMRSIAQGAVAQDERYELGEEYAEFGRVEVADLATRRVYRIKSDNARTIEAWSKHTSLFDPTSYISSAVVMLVYSFTKDGLTLAVAGTKGMAGSSRLLVDGKPVFVACWAYDVMPSVDPFDQSVEDPFDELGDLGDEEGEGEA